MGFRQISGIDPGKTEMIDQIHCDTNPLEVAYSRFSRFSPLHANSHAHWVILGLCICVLNGSTDIDLHIQVRVKLSSTQMTIDDYSF